MSFYYTWRILPILLATIVRVATQELDSQEVSDSTKSPVPFPVVLPVSYRVQDADYLFLKEAGQDIMGNSSMQTHTQPFVILRAGRLPVVSASYGPLSAERAVPPDLLRPALLFGAAGAATSNWKVQSFVLTPRVYSTAPAVRVLFYVAGRDWDDGGAEGGARLPCVTVYAFWQTQEVRGSCAMGGRRGTCMAELAPVAGWFSPGVGGSSRERPDPAEGNTVELYYQARPGADRRCRYGDRGGSSGQQSPAEYAAVTPMQRIGSVRLLQVPKGASSLSRLKLGNAIVIQTSSKPLKKTDIASFYILMASSSSLGNFTLRAVVKTGVSFRTATPSNSLLWDITLDMGADDSIAVVCQRKSDIPGKKLGSSLVEVLQMDFEVEELSSPLDSQVITWRLELPAGARDGGRTEGAMRIYTTQRDFVGLAPLIMDTEILNTAVLTGKKVVMPVRTVAVEKDGLVTDVSDFTDCNSTDEDVLKVSDRCDYVFVNGKEMKGKVRMKVTFTYSYLSAQLEMNVWIPRLPLQIEVSDTELSQIKGWRVPITASKSPSWNSEEEDRKGRGCMLQFQHALVRVLARFTAERADPREPQASLLGSDWQVDVTRLVRHFLKVEDPLVARLHAGRVLSGRDVGTTSIQVFSPLSDAILARKSISVVDDKVTITELGVQLVTGLALSLQLSPGSNRAILATATTQDVLQSPKQEAVVSAWVQFSDGSLTPLDIYDPKYYMVTVSSLDEGVVSVQGTPPAVVAVGEGQGVLVRVEMAICEACQKSKRKSTLAVGGGSLKVKFGGRRFDGGRTGGGAGGGDYGSDGDDEADGERKRRRDPPQQTAPASSASEREESAMRKVSTTVRSAGDAAPSGGGPGGGGVAAGRARGAPEEEMGGVADGSTAKSPGNLANHDSFPAQVEVDLGGEDALIARPLTDLEIGMYALLGVFCLAILVFLVNCVSYVVTFRHKRLSAHGPQEPAGHRHDWVWLDTDAELATPTNAPGGGPAFRQDNRCSVATAIDIGQEKAAPLPLRRNGCLASATAADSPPPVAAGDLRNKLVRSESLRSPTSKRKRVQFTTFGSLDRRRHSPGHSPGENGHGIHWVGKEEEEEDGYAEAGLPIAEPADRLL